MEHKGLQSNMPRGATEVMDYKIGDKVVYPNHGVGLVEQISYGVLNGRTERYFMIRIVSSGLRVMVPQSNSEAVGLRAPIQGKFRAHAHGFPPGSSRSPQEFGFTQPEQAAFLPRKENAGASQVFVGERDGHGAEYDFGIRGRPGSEVAGQGQAAVSVDDRKIRVKFR